MGAFTDTLSVSGRTFLSVSAVSTNVRISAFAISPDTRPGYTTTSPGLGDTTFTELIRADAFLVKNSYAPSAPAQEKLSGASLIRYRNASSVSTSAPPSEIVVFVTLAI